MANSVSHRVRQVRLLRRHWPMLIALTGASLWAQTAPPAPNASGSVTPLAGAVAAPSEAVQRQALGPYRMILRNAAVPNKVKSAASPTAAASRQPTPRQAPDSGAPTSPVEPTPTPTVAATPLAAPAVQVVEAAAAPPDATPPAPLTVAAITRPTPAPAAVATKTALVLIKKEPPTLSGALARESPSGVVRVAFNVNPDGSTSDLKIAASNNRRLNSAVLAAIAKWHYEPIDAAQATEVEMVFSND